MVISIFFLTFAIRKQITLITILKIMDYTINHDAKVVSPMHGYCKGWKTYYKKAEKLNYRYRSGYGFELNTEAKTFILADKDTFYRVVNKTTTNWNDIKDYQEIVKAWKYLRAKGYTTEDSYLNSLP